MTEINYSPAAARAQSFGTPWAALSTDAKSADQLTAGQLALPPHRAWRVPETVTWRENPFGEVNWVAQLHMLRWIDPLRRRVERGDLRHLDTWVKFATSWIEANPPGRGRAAYAWADMVEAARAVTFCMGVPMLEKHRPDVLNTVLRSIEEHGEWLEDESHIRTGNHALQQHQGLLVIGAVLERQDWVDLAVERSRKMLDATYDAQGVNEEGAVQYHQINYQWWNTLSKRVREITGTVPPEFDRVRLAPIAMAHATRPDGLYETIGDTEEFAPRGFPHPNIDYVSSAGEKGVPPANTVEVFDSGYVFGRSTWGTATKSFADADFYSLRFGPQNRIHGHADGMGLTLFANRAPVLVDSGKYAYDAKDPFRAHLLSREAHNAPSLTGLEYDRAATVELTAHSRSHGCEYFEFADEGYAGASLRRSIVISLENRLIFAVDSFESETATTLNQHWHLAPDAGHRAEDAGVYCVWLRVKGRFAFSPDTTTAVVSGRTSPIQGWYSPTWREKVPVRTVIASTSGRSGSIATAFAYGDSPLSTLTIAEHSDSPDGALSFTIAADGTSYTAVLGDSWGTVLHGDRNPADVIPVMSK